MSTIRVGVAGVGHLGYHHARNFASLENVALAGVVDPDPERAAKAQADFGAPVFDDVDALVAAGVDAVSVAVPTRAHYDVARRLIEAGVDVLVEKPLADTIEHARALVDLAQSHGRILQVGHIERFNGAVVALFDAIKAPRFIECHRLSPYPGRGDDVSVILDLMIHDLDIVMALAGTEVTAVDAVGVPVFSPYEDIANVRLRFASQCVANVTCSRISVERMRKIRVFAENMYVSTDYSAQEVLMYSKPPGPLPEGKTPMEVIAITPLEVSREEPLHRELAAFVECVRNRTRPLVAGQEGLAALELAHRIMACAQEQV